MRDFQRHTGEREALATELEDQATGWILRGSDDLCAQALSGADQLRAGAAEVTVGHLTYEVDEG